MAGRFSIEAVFKAIDRVSAPISKMQNRVGKFTRKMSRGLRSVNRSLSKMTSALKVGATRAIAGVGIVATGTALAIRNLANQGDELAKQSRRLNFPIEDLQEWKFAAEQSGVSTELFDKSIGAFSKRLGEARAGTGALVTILKKTNPQLLKQVTSADNVSQAFDIYIKALRGTKNASDRAALAAAGFSRAGLKMANIVDNSAGAIKALRAEQRLNGIITKEQAEASEAYNDAVNSLTLSIRGLFITGLSPLIPKLTEYALKIRGIIITNKELIGQRLGETIAFIKDNMSDFLRIARGVVSILGAIVAASLAVKTVIIATTIATKGWAAGLFALKAIVFAFNAVMGVAKFVVLAFNLAFAANPIGAIILAVTTLIGLGVLLIKNWDNIVAAITSAIDTIKPLMEFLAKPFTDLVGGISSVFGAVRGLLGGGEEEGTPTLDAGPQIVTPQERTAKTIEERRETSTAEVTIKDETGRAEMTQKGGLGGVDLILADSGAF